MTSVRGAFAQILCCLWMGALPALAAVAGSADGASGRTENEHPTVQTRAAAGVVSPNSVQRGRVRSTPRAAIPVSTANAAQLRRLLAAKAVHPARPVSRPLASRGPIPARIAATQVGIRNTAPVRPIVRAGGAPRSLGAASLGGPRTAGVRPMHVSVLDGGQVHRKHD